jgi:hypothetical protein
VCIAGLLHLASAIARLLHFSACPAEKMLRAGLQLRPALPTSPRVWGTFMPPSNSRAIARAISPGRRPLKAYAEAGPSSIAPADLVQAAVYEPQLLVQFDGGPSNDGCRCPATKG